MTPVDHVNSKSYRLVVISRCLPYEGIDHAGGEYVLRSIRAVTKNALVTVVAVSSERDRAALARTDLGYSPLLLNFTGLYASTAFSFIRRVQGRLLPLTVPVGLRRSIQRSVQLRSACESADVIEIQWTEMATFWKAARKATNADCRIVVVAHDVLSQRYERAMRAASRAFQPLHAVQLAIVRRRERALLKLGHAVVTFSEKDARLVKQLRTESPVHVVVPPLFDEEMSCRRLANHNMVLFVGAFARKENIDAADWLLNDIWPTVARKFPGARLVLAGAKSDTYLASVAGRTDGSVTATGFVESLAPYYRAATVAIVPLRLGAGVKFKTLTAMLWGIPVVSTPEGVEGLAPFDHYSGVTTDADDFAALILQVLREPASHEARALMARRWAEHLSGTEQFLQSILLAHGRAAPPTI